MTPVGREPSILSPPQMSIVAAVAEIMIPRTDTPGAIDVGVPGFIDIMLKNVYAQQDRERYLAGLAEFDAAAHTQTVARNSARSRRHNKSRSCGDSTMQRCSRRNALPARNNTTNARSS